MKTLKLKILSFTCLFYLFHYYFLEFLNTKFNYFQIAVNGEHFCSFTYRLPLAEIACLTLIGDVEETRVRQITLDVYPDPKICKPSRTLELKEGEPLRENLVRFILGTIISSH